MLFLGYPPPPKWHAATVFLWLPLSPVSDFNHSSDGNLSGKQTVFFGKKRKKNKNTQEVRNHKGVHLAKDAWVKGQKKESVQRSREIRGCSTWDSDLPEIRPRASSPQKNTQLGCFIARPKPCMFLFFNESQLLAVFLHAHPVLSFHGAWPSD